MIDEEKLIDEVNDLMDANLLFYDDASKSRQETLKEIVDLILDQPKVGEWIPFNKGEPKEEGLYLCYFDDGFITTVEYEDGDWNLWADSGEIIAWQPLPELYEVKRK